jgi:hypothetical protein
MHAYVSLTAVCADDAVCESGACACVGVIMLRAERSKQAALCAAWPGRFHVLQLVCCGVNGNQLLTRKGLALVEA